MNSALAQVVIPYGNFDDGFEKYLVAAITFLLLCFAVWQYFRDRKLLPPHRRSQSSVKSSNENNTLSPAK